MYQKILVALENGPADRTLLPHIEQLARVLNSRLHLVHVADGWAARHFDRLKLAESEVMKVDRDYLAALAVKLRAAGLEVTVELALGDPPSEIVRVAVDSRCDLIAMASHGHRLIGDIIHGSTIDSVRHHSLVPLLVVRAAA